MSVELNMQKYAKITKNKEPHKRDIIPNNHNMNATQSNERKNSKDWGSSEPLCICGSALLKTNARVYGDGGLGVVCDKCYVECYNDDVVYHCSKGQVSPHQDGYDLCEQCALQSSSTENRNVDIQRLIRAVLNQPAEQVIPTEVSLFVLLSFGLIHSNKQ